MKVVSFLAMSLSLTMSVSVMAAFGLPDVTKLVPVMAAFGLPDVTKLVPGMGGDKAEAVELDLDSLMNTQTELVAKVSDALLSLSTSQSKMAEALGLKEMAAIATANAESLKSGGLTGEDDMKKQLSSTMGVNKAIQKKMEAGVELDTAGKAKFAESLPFYGKGAYEMVTTGQQAATTAKTVVDSKDLVAMNKLSTLFLVAKKSPGLLSSFTKSTGNIIAFSKSNSIDTSDLESATAGW
jgi:hypothetical protein